MWKKIVEEKKFIPMKTFYKAPFIPDYNPFIEASFMHSIDESVMPKVEEGLKDLFGPHVYLAKSGYWYCWLKLDYRWLPDGRFQIGTTWCYMKKEVSEQQMLAYMRNQLNLPKEVLEHITTLILMDDNE